MITNMRHIAISMILLSVSPVLAFQDDKTEPNVAWKDGQIVFRQGYTPTSDQVNISTNCLQFSNFDDFNTKEGILRKIIELRLKIASLQDFPVAQLFRIRQLNWLVQYYGTLP